MLTAGEEMEEDSGVSEVKRGRGDHFDPIVLLLVPFRSCALGSGQMMCSRHLSPLPLDDPTIHAVSGQDARARSVAHPQSSSVLSLENAEW